jgi:hypothetical protein
LVVTFFFYHPSIHSTDFMIFLGRFFIQLFNFHSLNPACCLIKKHVEIERKRNGYHPWNQDLDISPPLFFYFNWNWFRCGVYVYVCDLYSIPPGSPWEPKLSLLFIPPHPFQEQQTCTK